MITALRGEAYRYFFQECSAADTTPTYIVDRLKARFRSHIYLFELDAKLNALKMRAGRFQEYCDAFTALASQCQATSAESKLFIFIGEIPRHTVGNPDPGVAFASRSVTKQAKSLDWSSSMNSLELDQSRFH